MRMFTLARLRQARRMVVADPEILGGEPVFRGTRIPVHLIADMTAQSVEMAEIVDGYPALTMDQVQLAVLYATAYPRRARPQTPPWRKVAPVRTTVVHAGRAGCSS